MDSRQTLPIPVPAYVESEAVDRVTVSYGLGESSAHFSVPVPQLGAPSLVESWPLCGAVVNSGAVQFTVDGEWMLGWSAIDTVDVGGIDAATRSIYAAILDVTRAHDNPYLVRVWNHVGSINEADAEKERYQGFCVGRYEALQHAGYTMGADLPSASAVGMPGHGLAVYFLAGRRPGTQIENPRQVAAYRYPPQYGPKSPSFSRATLCTEGAQSVLFVSGTSSVVGHRSEHEDDVIGQLDETLINLDALVVHALPGGSLADYTSLKTYVRRRSDFDAIAARLDAAFPSCTKIYLQSDICRSELLLEIEGVAVRRQD